MCISEYELGKSRLLGLSCLSADVYLFEAIDSFMWLKYSFRISWDSGDDLKS